LVGQEKVIGMKKVNGKFLRLTDFVVDWTRKSYKPIASVYWQNLVNLEILKKGG